MLRLKKSFIVFIVLCMVVTLLSACNNDSEESSALGDTSASEELFADLPERDFGGATVTFLVPGDQFNLYKSAEIMAQENSPEILNENVKRRNELVESKFNVKIDEVRTTTEQDMVTLIRNAVFSDVSEYDIVMPHIPEAAKLALEDAFVLLNDAQYIDLEKPCWDNNATESLSINHKNYFATGDISLLTLACTHAIVFNKDLVSKNDLENPYELVNEGKWTIDKLREMATDITADIDGVEGMSHTDRYGFLINNNFVTSMYVGSGNSLTGKDDDDIPYIALIEEQESAFPIFNKIFELVNDTKSTGIIDSPSSSYTASATADGGSVWDAATESVANELALFRAMAIIDIIDLGEYDCNFGILPVPKYSENQDSYHSLVSTLYATSAAIPISAADKEMSAIILQAMCEASTKTTKQAYFEVILKLRKIQDDESEAMLDKIFDERVYDLGIVFNWGGTDNSIGDFLNKIAFSGQQTFTSSLEAIADIVESDLDRTMAVFN